MQIPQTSERILMKVERVVVLVERVDASQPVRILKNGINLSRIRFNRSRIRIGRPDQTSRMRQSVEHVIVVNDPARRFVASLPNIFKHFQFCLSSFYFDLQ
jgi:hypothetical protein